MYFISQLGKMILFCNTRLEVPNFKFIFFWKTEESGLLMCICGG